ncbi:sialidase family protein [Streptomyces sp. SID13031]|uniref:sialidase family protein n=1 Tax=Streptomyces sp. SID13031 TaxID=2706046 RepID=UPI0013C9B963|nr:sialidase family protein [Streptomyces sp. SID13031]NEA31552.1 hypothetical protein [Streptomyces sp. SID13031]
MSELKDLSWEIQETVEPLPFEDLQRRGVRRRHRRQALAGAGVAAATAIAVLVVLLPFGNTPGTEKPPIATLPTAPVSVPVDQAAFALAHAKGSHLMSMTLASPSRWAAGWISASCATGTGGCTSVAVLTRDGVKAFAPVRVSHYATVQDGDEVIAVAGPENLDQGKNDPSWSNATMVRLTDQGLVQKPLRWAAPTTTFAPGEILIDTITQTGEVMVLNPGQGTLRLLRIDGTNYAGSPTRDDTGRWWLVAGKNDPPTSEIRWTDDGKTWNRKELDPANGAAKIAVSSDGNTIVASSGGDGATPEPIIKMLISTDRGATWQQVTSTPWGRVGGPVVFNDRSAVLLGQPSADDPEGTIPSIYTITGNRAKTLGKAPALLQDLTGNEQLLYGITLGSPSATQVASSTDRGKTWEFAEPR